jgi:AraC family cel operon transcriptional repressor
MSLTLRYKDILQDGSVARLTRATLMPARPRHLHDHDFFELFWVQNGQIRHHLPEGAETLDEGDIAFISPGQHHALQGRGADALIVSISFHPDLIVGLAVRHPAMQDQLFWAQPGYIRKHRGIRALAALNHAAGHLERSSCDTLAAEAFLLPLCAELIAESLPPDLPSWLSEACLAAKDPEVFRNGSAGLVARAGKAHPHVSRMMRKYLGQTPSDYVNGIRMAHAARALTTDDEPVADIAADCGIPNMSHFHKLFREAHGITPLQYRQRFQRQLVQPR